MSTRRFHLEENQTPKIVVEIDDLDVEDFDCDRICADVSARAYREGEPNDFIEIDGEACAEVKDVEVEPDSEPTYVDYGSQRVLYDSGKGGYVDSVEIGDADIDASFAVGVAEFGPDEMLEAIEAFAQEGEDLDELGEAVTHAIVKAVSKELQSYADKHAQELQPDSDDFSDYLADD